jgi:hypothetical protein
MDRQAFSRQLKELRIQASDAVLSYKVYLALWPTEDAVDLLNRHRGFFLPVRKALYQNMMMGLAKVFDGNKRTMSLVNLLHEAKKTTTDLVPALSVTDIQAMEAQLSGERHVIGRIRNLRDQTLAHSDAKPKPSTLPQKGEVDNLIKIIEEVFNKLSSGHERSVYDWSFIKERSAKETSEVLRILKVEMVKRDAETNRLLGSLDDN